MAFQQSAHQTMQRVARPTLGGQNASNLTARSAQEQQSDLSPTWVLFSPPTEVTATSYLSETDRSIQTLGRSRLSDLGSLNTGARAGPASAVEDTDESQVVQESVADLADDAELDSLDGHLPGFRSLPSRNQPIFPSHDGMGTFFLDQPALGSEAQDHIYQFERFNPRRLRRRLNSFEEAQFELEEAQMREVEKRQRIEEWRSEHGRIFLEEMQREARSRQKLSTSLRHGQQVKQQPGAEIETDQELDWHEQELALEGEEAGGDPCLLARLTRAALRELLGIDDRLLSILLGEKQLDTEDSARGTQAPSSGDDTRSDDSWQFRISEKISRELGLLVNQLSKHPGAFSTCCRALQMPLPHVGLPVIPESAADGRAATATTSNAEESCEADFLEFKPTVLASGRPVSLPSRQSSDFDGTAQEPSMGGTFTQEEWEREMDIKLVFRYLVSRFTSRSESLVSAETPRQNISKSQDAAAKAARLRHHPLISRPRPVERRTFKAAGPSSPVAIRHHTSCASQSTRRSARRSSCNSSRRYWDIGGSIKTKSVIASNGAMGSWGEV